MRPPIPIRGEPDYVERVPNVLPRREPLPMWVRSLALLIGAGAGAGGGIGIVAPATMRLAGIALTKDVEPKFEALAVGQKVSDKQRAEHDAIVDAKLEVLAKGNRDVTAKLAAISRQLAKRSVAKPNGGGGQGTAETP